MASTVDIPPTVPEVSPEQLKIMKIKHSNLLDHGYRSEPTSPTREYASLDGSLHANGHSHGMSSSSSLMRRSSSRHVSSTRRASSFVHSHRSQMSMELSSKAESKFFALMNLMSTASREASALKETWSLIASDRETLARENEELSRRVEEITEVYERKEKEFHHHGNELAERKRQVEKLLLELKAALTEVTTYKKKVSDRDSELERVRLEIVHLRDAQSSRHSDYEKTKKELEATIVQLRAAEEDRDHARHDSHKHHGELRALMREHSELKAKLVESHSKLETSRKEILSLTDRIKIWELERDEHLHEKDRLQEEIKRVKIRAETSYREFSELTERHERSTREHNKLKEYLRTLETERDDYAMQIENFRREVKTKTTEFEESEARVSEITLKYEHIKREVVSVKEKLRDIEVERTDLRSTIERVQEEHRLCILERDQLKEDLEDERRKHADAHRQITIIKESLRRSETTITEIRSEMNSLTERNKVLIREADEFRHKHGHHNSELSTLREQLALAQAEIRTLIESRDRACRELSDWKSKYEHVTHSYTEYENGSEELEMEIHSLRAMLRDVREQKERAISARHAADRERDEYIAKYEEKCRELERWEDNNSAHFHYSQNGGGRKTFSRTFSSGTTIRNGNGEATRNGESMSVNDGAGMFSSQ